MPDTTLSLRQERLRAMQESQPVGETAPVPTVPTTGIRQERQQYQQQNPSLYDRYQNSEYVKPAVQAISGLVAGPPGNLIAEDPSILVDSISDVGAGAGAVLGGLGGAAAGGGVASGPLGAAGAIGGTVAGSRSGAALEERVRRFLGSPPEEQFIQISDDPELNDFLNTAGFDMLFGAGGKLATKAGKMVGNKIVEPMLKNFPEMDKVLTQSKDELGKLFGTDVAKLTPEDSAKRGTYMKGQLKQVEAMAQNRAAKREGPIQLLQAQENQLNTWLKEANKAKIDPIFPEDRQRKIDYLQKQLDQVSSTRKQLESEPIELSKQDKAVTHELLKPMLADKNSAAEVAKDIVKDPATIDLAIQATNGSIKPLLQKEVFSNVVSAKDPIEYITSNKRSMELLLPGKSAPEREAAYERVKEVYSAIQARTGKKSGGLGITINGKQVNISMPRLLGHPVLLALGYEMGGYGGAVLMSVGTETMLRKIAQNEDAAKFFIAAANGAEYLDKKTTTKFIAAMTGAKITIQGGDKRKSGVIEMTPHLKNYGGRTSPNVER